MSDAPRQPYPFPETFKFHMHKDTFAALAICTALNGYNVVNFTIDGMNDRFVDITLSNMTVKYRMEAGQITNIPRSEFTVTCVLESFVIGKSKGVV